MGGMGGSNRKTSAGDTVVVPPDGGWGWMVVLGSFFIHVIADGITYSFGVVLEELLSTFHTSNQETAWIISILIAFTLSTGPIASAVTDRFGCRRATMSGAVIAAFGSFLSYFANSIWYLYFSMGFVTGIGFGLMYCPAIIIVTVYFEKKRSLATGVAVCGAGIGTFIFAPFTKYLIDQYTWRGAFLIYSGIILNCAVCGALFRDPPTRPATVDETSADPEYKNHLVNKQEHPLSASIVLDAIVEEDDADSSVVGQQQQQQQQQQRQPSSSVSAPQSPEKTALLVNKGMVNGFGPKLEATSVDDVRWLRQQNQTGGAAANELALPTGNGPAAARSLNNMPAVGGHHATVVKHNWLRQRGVSETHHHHHHHGPSLLNKKDIFYPGSVENLPEYRSNPELFRSVVSLHRPPSVQEPETAETFWDDIKISFMRMADIAVLKDPIFLVFAFSNLFTSMGMNPPLLFLPARAKLLGVHDEAWLLSAFGIANTLGRLIIGYISDRRWANRLFIYNFCLTLCGVGTVLSFLCSSFQLLAAYAAFYGLTMSAYISLTSVILVDLLGLNKLTNAFGWILLFEGVASLVGAPIAGLIADACKITAECKLKSYNLSFVFAGTLIAVSGLMLFPLPLLQRKLTQKAINKQYKQ